MSNTNLLERLPADELKAAPPSLQALLQTLLPLVDEVAELRERVAFLEKSRSLVSVEDTHTDLEVSEHKERVKRYHALVNQSFMSVGLTEAEEAEKQRLGQAIDAYGAAFYAPMLEAIKAIEAQK